MSISDRFRSRAPTLETRPSAPNGVTIGQTLQEARSLLCAVDESLERREVALEGEVLLAHVLGTTRASILAHRDEPLPASVFRRYESLLRRRLSGEPLAYIIGHREFYGLDFLVDRRVLIPRPETELLVAMAIARAKHLPAPLIVDVGTGSGAIAISIARALPEARVFATDASRPALKVATENSRLHGVNARIKFLHGDLLAPLPLPVDILAANLPYVAEDAYAGLQREVKREPSLALLGGTDGLAVYYRLLEQVNSRLRPGATLFLEIEPDQVPALLSAARQHLPLASFQVAKDYAGRDRVVALTAAG